MAKRARGIQTREAILRRAVQLASVQGLEGLTIGRLAALLQMSKAGLFAHFGSKEHLQLAIVDVARQLFQERVIAPAEQVPEGLPRVFALQSNWLAYLQSDTFKGGCFFAAAASEFDGRIGVVRSRIAAIAAGWRDLFETELRRALALGHLCADADPDELAFTLHALTLEANWARQLLGDTEAVVRAREASERCLRAASTAAGLRAVKARRVIHASASAA